MDAVRPDAEPLAHVPQQPAGSVRSPEAIPADRQNVPALAEPSPSEPVQLTLWPQATPRSAAAIAAYRY